MGRLREKAWEIEAKFPGRVKKHTDKVIQVGARLSKGASKRGEKWWEHQRKRIKKFKF